MFRCCPHQVLLVLLVLLVLRDLLDPWGLKDLLDLRGLLEHGTTEPTFRLLILWVRTLDIVYFPAYEKVWSFDVKQSSELWTFADCF